MNARINGVLNEKYIPQNMEVYFHCITVYVPLGVSAVLRNRVIAPVVQALCNRDQIDMKVCREMRFHQKIVFTPAFNLRKSLNAMVLHNDYLPERRTGWNLPPSSQDFFEGGDNFNFSYIKKALFKALKYLV